MNENLELEGVSGIEFKENNESQMPKVRDYFSASILLGRWYSIFKIIAILFLIIGVLASCTGLAFVSTDPYVLLGGLALTIFSFVEFWWAHLMLGAKVLVRASEFQILSHSGEDTKELYKLIQKYDEN